MRSAVLMLLTILLLSLTVILVYADTNYIIYVYGNIHCPHCAALKKFIVENYGASHLYFCDVGANRTCAVKFYNIIKAFGLQPAIPLAAVIVDGKATGIVIGELPVRSVWDKLVQPADLDSHIPIYAMTTNGTPAIIGYVEVSQEALAYLFIHGKLPSKNTSATLTSTVAATSSTTSRTTVIANGTSTRAAVSSISRQAITNRSNLTITHTIHSETATQATSASENMDFFTALSLTVSLSLADSVNPCTIYLYTILLIAASMASIGIERKFVYKRVVAVGLAFALAVLIGYLLLGLGLIAFVSSLPKIFFTAVGVGFGLWVLYSALTGRERVAAKKSMVRLLPKASKSLLFSFALGLLATFTLLPCSAGPYIVFAGIASKLSIIQATILLIIYNLVFISPLIIVLMAVLLGVSRQSVRDFLIRYNRVLSIIAGLLLIAIALYASLI